MQMIWGKDAGSHCSNIPLSRKKKYFLRGNHQIKEKYEDIWKAILLFGLPLFYVKVKDSEHEIMWAE